MEEAGAALAWNRAESAKNTNTGDFEKGMRIGVIMTLSPNFFKLKALIYQIQANFDGQDYENDCPEYSQSIFCHKMKGEVRSSYSAQQNSSQRTETGSASGIFDIARLTGSSILVNLTTKDCFEYGLLYRISSLAIRTGGLLEVSNEDMAIYTFPNGGISAFLEEIGTLVRISKTVASPREKGDSKINIRFRGC